MKKFVSLTLALILAMSITCIPALAANETGATTNLTFTHQNVPEYTIVIPSAVELSTEGTKVMFETTKMSQTWGYLVSITLKGTSSILGNLTVTDPVSYDVMEYKITRPDGTEILPYGNTYPYPQLMGTEVCSFRFVEQKTVTFTAMPSEIQTNGTYKGHLTFGIALVEW